MTTRKHLKRRARSRAVQSGQSYATALRDIRREQQEDPMPAAAGNIEDVVASCSFCGKPHHKVTKVVAGPGVYICNECVDLCATIIADASRETPEETERLNGTYFDRPAREILALLPALARSAARVEAELAGWVGRLRHQGTGWPEIAGATGLGVEEARRRFQQGPPAQDIE